jgi:predicted dehydrogenase
MKKLYRFGILGTAAITPTALLNPAKDRPDVQIAAIGSRNLSKTQTYAKKHNIPRCYGSYEELIADPDIDAIYNPLPNNLHAEWTIKALRAGKHVLCEKPIASNAAEARQMKAVTEETGLILSEAFHYRYHPLTQLVKNLCDRGDLGTIQKVEIHWGFNIRSDNIRLHFALAGGAIMDVGCYAINFVRFLAGQEPAVVKAEAKCSEDQIDGQMYAELQFPDSFTAIIDCGVHSPKSSHDLRIVGSKSEFKCNSFFVPYPRAKPKIKGRWFSTRVKFENKSTYYYQLRAFLESISNTTPPMTDINDGIKNMTVIDAIYTKAGLKIRGT